MKNKVKLERTNIFLSAEEKRFYLDIAEKNEQSMTWILRKVLKNYYEYCKQHNVKNASLKEINKTLTNIDYHEDLVIDEVKSTPPVEHINEAPVQEVVKSEVPSIEKQLQDLEVLEVKIGAPKPGDENAVMNWDGKEGV